jgi:hypothetical protein
MPTAAESIESRMVRRAGSSGSQGTSRESSTIATSNGPSAAAARAIARRQSRAARRVWNGRPRRATAKAPAASAGSERRTSIRITPCPLAAAPAAAPAAALAASSAGGAISVTACWRNASIHSSARRRSPLCGGHGQREVTRRTRTGRCGQHIALAARVVQTARR